MRVLALCHLYVPHHNAGSELMLHQMLRALVEAGHQVVVQLSMRHPLYDTGPYTHDGVHVIPHEGKTDPFRWINDRDGPDLIVTHHADAERATILGARFGVPVVQVLHNMRSESRQRLGRYPPHLVVYNTWHGRDEVRDWWARTQRGAPPPEMVVHPGVDREVYRVTPGDRITLVNLTADKGSDVFYALADLLPTKRFLGVVGAYGEQDIRDRPNVEIVGHNADMPGRVYARTRILLAPSVHESYGRVVVEAACAGIPAVATDLPGFREALGDAGTYCRRDDLDGWRAALSRLGTPKGWRAASQRASARADLLDTAGDLAGWVIRAEEVARRGSALSGRRGRHRGPATAAPAGR